MNLPVASSNPTEAYKKALEVLGLFFGQRTGLDVRLPARRRHLRPAVPLDGQLAEPPVPCRGARQAGRSSGMRYGPPKAERRPRPLLRQGLRARASRWSTPRPNLQHRIYNLGNGRATTAAELVAGRAKGRARLCSSTSQPGGDQTYMDLEPHHFRGRLSSPSTASRAASPTTSTGSRRTRSQRPLAVSASRAWSAW